MTKKEDTFGVIGNQLKSMKIISDELSFRVLRILAEKGPLSFSQLKTNIKSNPNSLSNSLKKLYANGLITNYYEKKEDKRIYSFYTITEKGRQELYLNIDVPLIRKILTAFKDFCRSRGWKTPENIKWVETEDWVEVDGKYHEFLWVKGVHPSSFKRIVSDRRFVVREGLSYRVVEASYIAWLFSEAPSETLVKIILENPTFNKRIAIYDLSPLLEGENVCKKVNNTDSPVFQEFETFLKKEFKTEFKLIYQAQMNYTLTHTDKNLNFP